MKRFDLASLSVLNALARAGCTLEDNRAPDERAPGSQAFGDGFVVGQFVFYTLVAFVVGFAIWWARRSARRRAAKGPVHRGR